MTLSDHIRHFFHVVSNVRPVVWIGLYVALVPVFAGIYTAMPDSQFRIPDGAGTDYGSWLYYSIVTITTLGFGDYTPAHGWAQTVTALEVMCGLVLLGFFLNAVGSMKSEIDVESEIEKQRRLHEAAEQDKLTQSIPMIMHNINRFLAFCFAISTPAAQRKEGGEFDDRFPFSNLAGLYLPSELPIDHTSQPVVEGFIKSARSLSLYLDSLQNRVDLTLWPPLMEQCFSFVAAYQMFSSTDALATRLTRTLDGGTQLSIGEAERVIAKKITDAGNTPDSSNRQLAPVIELYDYIRRSGTLARQLEVSLTQAASPAGNK